MELKSQLTSSEAIPVSDNDMDEEPEPESEATKGRGKKKDVVPKDATSKKKGTKGGKKVGATPEPTQGVAPTAPSISEAATCSTVVEEVEPLDFISIT